MPYPESIRYLTYSISFNPHDSPKEYILLLLPLYGLEIEGEKQVSCPAGKR